jgi:hypothetical protein
MLFQDSSPIAHTSTRPLRTHVGAKIHQLVFVWMNAMGREPGRLNLGDGEQARRHRVLCNREHSGLRLPSSSSELLLLLLQAQRKSLLLVEQILAPLIVAFAEQPH